MFPLHSYQVLGYFCKCASEIPQEALIYGNSELMQESSIRQNCTLCLLYPHSWTLKVSWESDERVNPSESFCNTRLASREHRKMSRTKIWSISLFWTHPFIWSYRLWLVCPGVEHIISWCQPACWWVKRNCRKIMRQLWEGNRNPSHSNPDSFHRNLLSKVFPSRNCVRWWSCEGQETDPDYVALSLLWDPQTSQAVT